jgi:glycosyltransferase involved in cell wall biosynthesis
MLHIYRQVTSLARTRPLVIAQKREEVGRFPFDPLIVVGKPWAHFVRRFWFKEVRVAPWQISSGEVRRLADILAKTQARLLHIYFGHIAVHLLPLIRSWGGPTVVSFHGADVMVDLEKPAYRQATIEMLNAVRLVLVRSESLGRALEEIGCPPEKIRIQRTGIPVDEITYRQRVWPDEGSWRFVQASRLIEKKGLKTSLKAFARFASQYPKSSFVICGEGPLRPELETQSRSLGLGDKVSFPGFLSQLELRELFYRSHVFLHPSEQGIDGNQEGVPNSMLEAMASGLAVFASAHGGIPEAIDDGESGILVPEGDDAGLANALFHAVKHPDELTRLARTGAEVVRQRFEQRAQTQKLEGYYFEAIGGSVLKFCTASI